MILRSLIIQGEVNWWESNPRDPQVNPISNQAHSAALAQFTSGDDRIRTCGAVTPN